MKGLHVQISKRLGKLEIDVAFSCPEGSTLALIGPSGAGKTTIIRMVAGLERPDDGTILFNGETFFDQARGIHLSPQKRRLGYVFQDYTLFPHLSLFGNAAFAARDRQEVEGLFRFFGLNPMRDRKPHQVSGGEKQRCAICQAMATRPRLLLLDEPFSALDVVTRHKLREELKKIKEERRLSVLYVTHDVTEALYMADVILPIVNGKIDRDWLEGITHSSGSRELLSKAVREPKLSLAL
ncbi:MAG: ATP-binding cassette domain-containing protein [Syntrophaceae bacterium]|nr:ATP-binding cassette domain-containing protein [Syntrophaceae bacterium]